jgi:hypothetical protein
VPSSVAAHFLEDYDGRGLPWVKPAGTSAVFETDRVLFGNGDNALEVAIASARGWQPKADELRTLFKKRQAGRPAPVLLVVTYASPNGGTLAAVVGTSGDPAPVTGLPVDRLERVCASVLAEPDRHSAVRAIERLWVGLKDQQSPGLVNSGLFASHELHTGVPARPDWEAARQAALPMLGTRGLELIHARAKVTTYRVRWTTGPRSWKESFRNKAQAGSYEAELRSAARRGEAFNMDTGRPVSWSREANSMSWYDFCVAYVDMKWKHSAAKRRATIAWTLVTVMPPMIATAKGAPERKAMRRALRQWGFNTNRRAECPEDAATILGWLSATPNPSPRWPTQTSYAVFSRQPERGSTDVRRRRGQPKVTAPS